MVLRHTLPVFTGLGRCPIINWDFSEAVSIFGLDALPVALESRYFLYCTLSLLLKFDCQQTKLTDRDVSTETKKKLVQTLYNNLWGRDVDINSSYNEENPCLRTLVLETSTAYSMHNASVLQTVGRPALLEGIVT